MEFGQVGPNLYFVVSVPSSRPDHGAARAHAVADLVRSSPALRARLGYRRFGTDALRILVLDARYHLVDELAGAFASLGHEVRRVPLADDAEQMVRTLLLGLSEARPDFVLSVNHLGFDADGAMGALLETLEIPVAVWYADAPAFVLRGRPVPAAAVTTVFSWERETLRNLRDEVSCEHLPLATDPERFCGPAVTDPRPELAFVGDSSLAAIEKWRARLDAADAPTVRRLRAWVGTRPRDLYSDPEIRKSRRAADQLAAATWQATASHRKEALSTFARSPLHIYGDAGWKGRVSGAQLREGPSYGAQLGAIYRAHGAHLNLTSLQMPTAVNQRVFDVPAAGGFVLSDGQEDLHALFAEDEMVTFECPEEVLDRARYYVRHPHRRAELSARARARVLSDHTYAHR